MRIQHNIAALNSHRNMGINNSFTNKNLEKLSSGYRINRAGDDAAGLAISEKMRGQIRGLAMAEQNTSNAINLIQTAEGGLNETHAILQRMRELAVQSSNGTYDQDVDRVQLDKEFQAVKDEIDRIAESTQYNGINLLDGSLGGVKTAAIAPGTDYKGIKITAATSAANKDVAANEHWSGSFSVKAITGETIGTTQGISFEFSVIDSTGKATNYTYETSLSGIGGTPKVELNGETPPAEIEVGTAGDLKFNIVDSNGAKVEITMTAANLAALGENNGASLNNYTYSGTGLAAGVVSFENAYAVDGKGQLVFQIGANGSADQRVGLSVTDQSSTSLGLGGTERLADASIASQDAANKAIDIITAATNQVSGTRADLGAMQNRLEHTMNNLGVTKENLTASESTIRDVDMAKEMMEFTKNQILVQSSQAMLAQANQLPQGVLSLLR